MSIENTFDHASSVMTVISFLTFLGILWWALVRNKEEDFAAAAQLPFADEHEDTSADEEQRHV
jgi:cytochrome c oxidase cbb3-type subunit 4